MSRITESIAERRATSVVTTRPVNDSESQSKSRTLMR